MPSRQAHESQPSGGASHSNQAHKQTGSKPPQGYGSQFGSHWPSSPGGGPMHAPWPVPTQTLPGAQSDVATHASGLHAPLAQ